MNVDNNQSLSDKTKWRIELEHKYALICKNCHRKVLDPSKNNIQQIFTKARCPHCFFCKEYDKYNKNRGVTC